MEHEVECRCCTLCGNGSVTRLPVDICLGLYSDVGELYPDSFGLTLKFSYAGSRLFKKS